MEELYLGSHIGMAGPDFYLETCKTALSWGENTFMFYTGAPQNTRRAPTSTLKIPEGRAFLKEHGIDESKIVVHAPYIINLGNTVNPDTYQLAVDFLSQELQRVADFHLQLLVLHPGASVGAPTDVAIKAIIDGLNEVFRRVDNKVIVCLETMAGKGSEVGRTFEEIAEIIAGVEDKSRIGVCLDTCHINDAGYDIHDPDGVLAEFDRVIGLSYLKLLHINDSKNPRGSHKDRHDNLGYGTIGFETLSKWVHHPLLNGLPKVLETPYVGEKPPYQTEVEMLHADHMDPDWREKL